MKKLVHGKNSQSHHFPSNLYTVIDPKEPHMELQTDDLINGLLEEVKRLTLENIAYKAALQKMSNASDSPISEE